MNVHDVGSYTRRLEPGMVFTIEPGLYIPADSLGIRIEDDILVTETGGEILSSGAPRTVAEIERRWRLGEIRDSSTRISLTYSRETDNLLPSLRRWRGSLHKGRVRNAL